MDGSSYLYRAFHALPDLRTSRGEPTGALRGVLSMLRRIAEDEKPDYFAVVFDAPGKTFRDDWYPLYKAQRPPMPEDLVRQIEPLHELVRAHGWPLLMVAGVEADDVIGTLAVAAVAAGIDCVISTGDKDLAQLVRPGIRLVNTMSNENLDEAGVLAKFGVRADQVLDLLSLTGDAVDNVPGVPKVGPKTAAKWLTQYGTLDAVIEHASEVPGVVGENLRATLDWLPLGKRLLTVKTDCALPLAPADLKLGAADDRSAAAAVRALRIQELAQRRQEPRHAQRCAGGSPPARAAPGHAQFRRAGRARRGCRGGSAAGRSPALRDRAGRRDAGALAGRRSRRPTSCASIPRRPRSTRCRRRSSACRSPSNPASRATSRWRTAIRALRTSCRMAATLARLLPWFADPSRKKVGQNVKYDQHVLANHGLALAGVAHDTLLQSYVLEAHRPHDMDNLAWRHLNVKTIPYAEVAGKGAKQIGFDQVSIADATAYSAEDADITLQLHRALYPRVAADLKLDHVYAAIEMPVREVLFEMERDGVMLDAALLAAQSKRAGCEGHGAGAAGLSARRPAVQSRVAQAAGRDPVRQDEAADGAQDRHRPAVDRRGSADRACRRLPLPKVLLEHRALSKLKSTYTDKLPQMVNRADGPRAHDVQPGDGGHRPPRSSDPNLQNIPVRTAEGRRIREAFIAPAGSVIVSADYSQIELRIMAHLSSDPALVKAFHEGADIHKATAADIFGVPVLGGHDRPAALHQSGQLRLDLRDGRIRPRATARHRAQRGATVHRPVFPALSRRARLHGEDARIRARAR